MVHSLSQPARKNKINFIDCIVFFSYSAENRHLFGSRNLPFRNERVPVKQSTKRKISSHSRFHEIVIHFVPVRS